MRNCFIPLSLLILSGKGVDVFLCYFFFLFWQAKLVLEVRNLSFHCLASCAGLHRFANKPVSLVGLANLSPCVSSVEWEHPCAVWSPPPFHLLVCFCFYLSNWVFLSHNERWKIKGVCCRHCVCLHSVVVRELILWIWN